jgi:ribosomal protein S18 acetylase RimI-like enzyme
LDTLRSLAVECWRLFGLRGFARVDFRVDVRGRPWILEINTNPCLSPDAGFAAALARANVPLERAVEWIIEDALRPAGGGDALAAVGPAKAVPGPGRPAVGAKRGPAKSPSARLRSEVRPTDLAAVRRIVESTGLFRPGEVDVAAELVQAHLDKGAASGYEFVFAEHKGDVAAYACFGRNLLTLRSWDLYWIAVEKSVQGNGLGRLLLAEVERRIAAAGGGRIYIETSHRADYRATRGFYESCGYKLEAVLEDFYAPGDGKAVYVRAL